MTAYRRNSGERIRYTPGSEIAAGTIVDRGVFIGIAEVVIPANTEGWLSLEGIVEMPVDAAIVGTGFVQGALIGLDLTAQDLVAAGLGDADFPVAVDKAVGDTTAQIWLRSV